MGRSPPSAATGTRRDIRDQRIRANLPFFFKQWGGTFKKPNHPERSDRQARVSRAVAFVQLELLGPAEAAKAVFDRYVAGDLATQEMAAAIRALNAQEFGPIHISGD
jgi:hypothetical protein